MENSMPYHNIDQHVGQHYDHYHQCWVSAVGYDGDAIEIDIKSLRTGLNSIATSKTLINKNSTLNAARLMVHGDMILTGIFDDIKGEKIIFKVISENTQVRHRIRIESNELISVLNALVDATLLSKIVRYNLLKLYKPECAHHYLPPNNVIKPKF